jgi:hypothetical protein
MPCTCGLECPFFQFAKEYVERFEALDRKFPAGGPPLTKAERASVDRRVDAFWKRKGKNVTNAG